MKKRVVSKTILVLLLGGILTLASTIDFALALGTLEFVDSGQSLGTFNSWGVALGDVDGDGDLDAFVANGGPNKVWVNDGSGVFSDSGQSLGAATSYGMDLGDVDGDGDLDAFVANAVGPNKVWLNNGSGVFSDSGQSLGTDTSLNVALGDVDGDGDLDAFVANLGQPNKVWVNDGAGVYSDLGQSLGSGNSYDVALGDVDGDGDLDAFVANLGQPNKVWVNLIDLIPPDIAAVSQSPLEDNVLPEDEVEVNATVTDDLSGVKRVSLNYTNGNGTWIILDMTNIEGNIWNGVIPNFSYSTNVTYVIEAEDNVNNTITTEEMGYEYGYHVIPEFPSFLILPLSILLILVVAFVYRRKHSTQLHECD